MSEVLHFGKFQLNIDRKGYLVEIVETQESEGGGQNRFSDLPEWAFRSKHAIWLLSGSAPLRERARKGEEFKRQLLQQAR